MASLGALRRAILVLLAGLVAALAAACGGNGNTGFPKDPGQYEMVKGTLAYDGQKYSLSWLDPSGSPHQAEGRDVRMQKDERTFLEIGPGSPLVHLKEDEAVVVRGRDRDGPFESPWFPFFLGYALGGGLGGGNPTTYYPGDQRSSGPGYQYPPSDSFGRGDQLNGSVERSKPEPPDYKKVPPAPYAVSGQGAGTGGGNAATNKSAAPASGQGGGTGGGSAASNKGTFQNGGGSSGGGGTGVSGGASDGSSSKPPTGAGSGGGSGSGSGASSPSRSSGPSSPPRAPSRR